MKIIYCLILVLITTGMVSAQFTKFKPTLSLNEKSQTSGSTSDTATKFGDYTPGIGFNLAKTKMGDLNFKLFSYVRYLNQKASDDQYINAFNDTTTLKLRQDWQFAKVNIQFHGWLFDPNFRYLAYVWSNNNAQGQTASVVVAGNLSYIFNKHFTIGAGIGALPGVRSTEGTFPYWLTNDNRLIADDYFRPSYTTGIWFKGKIADDLNYNLMVGNNLSQLGVDASQLSSSIATVSGALTWYPSTGEFGPGNGYGDFTYHEKAATRLGGHFTYSKEDRLGQPTSDAFENVQLRVSDGSVIFKANLFGNGIRIDTAAYRMASFDFGVKYKGLSLEGEYYFRWLNNFSGSGVDDLGFNILEDNGFQLLASGMLIKQVLQLYASYSKVFGQYGDPYGIRTGLNIFPWKNQYARCNIEYIYAYKSPVGGSSVPIQVGSTGSIFHVDFVLSM